MTFLTGRLSWCDNLHILAANRYKVEAILFTWWWLIWKARNNALHNDIHESGKEIFHSITSLDKKSRQEGFYCVGLMDLDST